MNYRIINGRPYGAYNIDNLNSDNLSQNKIQINKEESSFSEILNGKLTDNNGYSFKVSKHASERLRELGFTDRDYKNIENAMEKAKKKGSKNTVIVYRDSAIVASIENNIIITAVHKNRADDNVFTNIDSAVIL
ncbi:TIGR02530 family flagellar biosynthesis protein [uncultured Clostridium sp.]|uniref:TIGR02530 family flagellar biosynthesis protein n=1 Tax=uncultured Clostridium sp. TaxID=59620 RepID=UPI002603DC50|nr:TIGR02530 family flagellar biosynthesis protein [uncultured Clostridium sp.]